MSNQKHIRILLTAVTPLIFGGLIYIIYRSETLLMFKYFNKIGLSENIIKLRQVFENIILPSWTIFSLPDALWIFSFTNLMLIIWDYRITIQSIIWILIGPFIGIVLEIGQAFHLIRGTFDIIDLIFIIIASILPFNKFIHFKNKRHEGY
jgi:hypothetical protein